jgi:twitching motility protein PilT
VVFERLRKGLRAEPTVVNLLRTHQWHTDKEKKELIEKFLALHDLDLEHVIWTAVDPLPDLRAAGLAVLRQRKDRAPLDALVAMLRTRSVAVRRAVERFMKELAGPSLAGFVQEMAAIGDDYARLAAMELAQGLPSEVALEVYTCVLGASSSSLRARALKAIAEARLPGYEAMAASLALPLLSDENEEIRFSALAVLARHPQESYIPDVLRVVRTSDGRVAEAAIAALKKILPASKGDHAAEIVPLLADGGSAAATAAVALLQSMSPDLVVRQFLEHFRSSNAWMRNRALEAAVNLPKFIPALLAVALGPDKELARRAAEATLSLQNADALPVWLSLLQDRDLFAQSRALEKLGRYGQKREDVFAGVAGALRDPELAIPASAALADLQDPRGAGPLFEAFKSSADRPDVQLEILEAMSRLSGVEPRVGPVLAKISTFPNVDLKVREKARYLVGKVQGDAARDALPEVTAAPAPTRPSNATEVRLVDFLAETVQRGGSDFHLATGFVPHRRVQGVLEPLDAAPVTREGASQLLREVLDPADWARLEEEKQLDLCVKIAGVGRFRANFFSQREGLDAAFRVIPETIPTMEEISLPESAFDILHLTQGLVLVTGPSGCGKSTTLAAMLGRINDTRPCHIITIEDPVEFIHANKEALVTQRQVPQHTASFARALKAALREDPDVILVGELRDLETMDLAITASETGHLVFGTLHTTNASATIDRLINTFPAGQQSQVRTMLADSLKAVISQALLPRRTGDGRVAAWEILRATTAVAALIRESKTYQLPSILQTGQLAGMMTLDQSLLKLVEEGKVSPEVAMDKATKKEPFEKLLEEERQALA